MPTSVLKSGNPVNYDNEPCKADGVLLTLPHGIVKKKR